MELYIYAVPGLWTTGVWRKSRIQCSVAGRGSVSMPQPMHSTSRTVRSFRFSLGFSGAHSGKISMIRSSSRTLPSVYKIPTAVAA